MKLADLRRDPCLIAAQFGGQQPGHGFGHRDGRPGIQEKGPGAASQNIFNGERHLLARGPHNLGRQIRERGIQFDGQLRRAFLECANVGSIGAVYVQAAS